MAFSALIHFREPHTPYRPMPEEDTKLFSDLDPAVFGQYDLHNVGLAYMRMIRTPEWKLVRHHFADGLDELYDLKNDPDERRNVYNDEQHRATRAALQQRRSAWQQSVDDPILKGPRGTR